MNFISRAENSFSTIIEAQYYEEVKDGNVNWWSYFMAKYRWLRK
jgi:hypothetical protein